jgi:heptosyltransferase II
MQNHLPSALPAPRRIVVRGANWLGDAVMTTPALLRLRERFPEARLALLTPEKLRDLWLRHPAVNEVIAFAEGEGAFSVSRKLREGNFDLALVLPNSPRSALEVWLAGIPRRIGYARPWRNWFLTEAVPARPGHVRMRKRSAAEIKQVVNSPVRATGNSEPIAQDFFAHQIHDYLRLAAALGARPDPLPPRLEILESEIDAVRRRFQLDAGVQWLGLNPGAEYGPAKRWPADRFIAVAREVPNYLKCGWVILGGTSELALAAEIESAIRSPQSAIRNLAGRTSLRELMALLKSCRVLLANDSGPMHVAAALGTPVVAPFGSTSPELTGPGLPGDARLRLLRCDAPCSPCFRRTCPIDFRCMTGISVERVVEAVLETALSG